MAIANSGAINVVQALSRSLDKVFDEAQLTGLLSLNGRNLKDFPNVASRYDLTDTVEVDLSKNRFTEFPVQISEFVSLETLYLYHNCIRSIPIAVQYLESLTHLDLSRNQLQCIPAVLCTLPLEVLLLGNNRLTSLPKEIRQLSDTLMELDLSCNKLEGLPMEIGDLKKLRVLNARENLLSELPYELCKLKLQVLDVSSNRISQLNVDLRHMTSLVQFDLNHNPLVFPAAKLCNSGRVHVFKALEVAFVKQTKRQGVVSHEQDFQRKSNTLKSNAVRLIPTDPEDYKYVLNPKTERRKNRHHTVAADSGYSTLTDDTSKSLRDISDVHLRKRSPPVGEESPSASSPRHRYETDLRVNPSNLMSFSMYNNCATKDLASGSSSSKTSTTNGVLGDCRTGSFVEEVMSACMERMSNGSFAADNKSPLQQNSSSINVQHNQMFLSNNGASTNKDDEVTRELWRQREEYLNRKKRAGLLRMEVLQDAGESMLSPSVSNGVDLNCNNCNGTYQKTAKISYMSQSWMAGENRCVSVNVASTTPTSSVINEESSSLSSYNISELTPSPCEAPPTCPIPVQQMISSTNDSAAVPFCPTYGNNTASSVRTPPPYATTFAKEKAFSPPRSVRSEVIQSIYNGTSASRYAATNVGSCEARPLTEQPLAVYSMDGAIDQTPQAVVVLPMRDERPSNSEETQPNSVENCTIDGASVKLLNGEHENKTKKRVNVVDSAPKRSKETVPFSNGRGSLSSSQSSVSSSSSSSRAKSAAAAAGNKCPGTSAANGVGTINGGGSNARKSSMCSTNALPIVKLMPPPVPAKSTAAAATSSTTVNANNRRTSVSNRPVAVFHRGSESLQNGTSSHVVNSNSLSRKVSDSVERQQQIVDEMRKALEEKLNITLPHDHVLLSEMLSDGVHLCNYLNILRPKTVRSVHMPTEAAPKLTLAKRNVENFLTGCRRLAIPETNLFAIGDVVDKKKNLVQVGRSVNFINKHIVNHSKPKSPTHPLPAVDHGGTHPSSSSTNHAPLQHRTSAAQRMTKV